MTDFHNFLTCNWSFRAPALSEVGAMTKYNYVDVVVGSATNVTPGCSRSGTRLTTPRRSASAADRSAPCTSTASASAIRRRQPSATARISSRRGELTASTRRQGTCCVTGTAPTRIPTRPPSAVWPLSADSLPPRLSFVFTARRTQRVWGAVFAVERWPDGWLDVTRRYCV